MPTTGEPLVSVVMVIRNVERFLAEAIESVLSQTFRDFEFIIVDFGSTDNSKSVAAEYAAADRRIQVSEITPCGYIEAKIAACALPKGRYVAIQDADDVSLPDRLSAEVDFMVQHPEVGLLGGAVQWIDSQGRWLQTPDGYPTEDAEIRRALKTYNPFWHPTAIFLREAYAREGGYRGPSAPSDDYDLWLRISEHYQCANLKQVVLKYRIHPQQLSLRKRKEQIFCVLAAQASALLRKTGSPDPLNWVPQVTPTVLKEMGVSEATQRKALAEGYLYWIKQVYAAGDYGAVAEATAEMLRLCDGVDVVSLVSEASVIAGQAYWKQRKVLLSCRSFGRAVVRQPSVAKRALHSLRRRLGSTWHRFHPQGERAL
jgi:glycosyltransferase involved in cell wall biosynthesis